MDKALTSALFSCILFTLFISSYAQNCNSYSFSNNRQFSTCMELSVLRSSIHWNLDETTNTVEIAFRRRGTNSSRWVAWALNPTGQRMVGSQGIIAFQNSTRIRAYTTSVMQISPSLEENRLSFGVWNISATLIGDVMTIYARLQLTDELLSTNQVWQEGPITGGNPAIHPVTGDNIRSFGRIDFRAGQAPATAPPGGRSMATRRRGRNVRN